MNNVLSYYLRVIGFLFTTTHNKRGDPMLTRILTITKKKGQGIVEYAVLLAFVVGLAVMLQGVGIRGAIKDTFDNVVVLLRGNPYAPYFQAWHDKTSAWLSENASAEERLQADQEALARIARAFIGLDEDEVGDLIEKLSLNKGKKAQFDNLNNYKEVTGKDGWSNTLVPLSYAETYLDNSESDKQYIHLDFNGNADTVKLLTNDVESYHGYNSGNPEGNRYDSVSAVAGDRIFYSDGMINANGNSADNKMVTLQVHYNNGVVDQVNIQARNVNPAHKDNYGQKNSNKNNYDIVGGLNLNVTKTEITQIQD